MFNGTALAADTAVQPQWTLWVLLGDNYKERTITNKKETTIGSLALPLWLQYGR